MKTLTLSGFFLLAVVFVITRADSSCDMTTTASPTTWLGDGGTIPVVGLGVYKASPEECYGAVKAALQLGYRHIDTAHIYGNEADVGRAIRDSGVPRQDIFVTTKVWTGAPPVDGDGFKDAVRAVDEALAKLGTDYIDLMLLHSPHFPGVRLDRWRGLEESVRAGKVRHIGVSNYGVHHLEELLKVATIRPALNQIEVHPWCFRRPLIDYCKAHDIPVEAYSPLAKASRLADPKVGRIASALGRSPAQVVLRYLVQKGLIVLPKSVHAGRIKQNLAIFDFELSPAHIAALDELDEGAVTGWDPTTMD